MCTRHFNLPANIIFHVLSENDVLEANDIVLNITASEDSFIESCPDGTWSTMGEQMPFYIDKTLGELMKDWGHHTVIRII